MSQGSGNPHLPITWGTLPAGATISNSSNLNSVTDRNFYQITLPAGVDASISLSGMQAGSDFDLYLYHTDLTPIGCSTTRGTATDSVTTQFGSTQSSNTVVVEVSAYSWSAGAGAYNLAVTAVTPGPAGNQIASSLQNTFAARPPVGTSNTATSQACMDPGISQGSGSPQNPQILGTISAGQTISASANLQSATDRNFYRVALPAAVDADITLTGIQPGSDFDLYLYHTDLTPIGCSITRGTGTESITTQFGTTQNSNIAIVEVSAYSWSASSQSYTLSVKAH
jgi:hypothetical protein